MAKKVAASADRTEASLAFKRVTKWHVLDIVSLAAAFLTSATACLCMSYANFALPDCVLFSNWTCKIDIDKNAITLGDTTTWGKKSECYLTQYGPASAAVASFILCWFYVFFRPTKEAYFFKKKTAASKLILPSICLCLIFTVTVFVSTITLQLGFDSWCNYFHQNPPKCIIGSCSAINNFTITGGSSPLNLGDSKPYDFLIAAIVFSWLSAFIWLANLILLILRCYLHVDFPTYFFRSDGVPNTSYSIQTETDSD